LAGRGEASVAYAVSQFVSGATSLLVGVLVDRLGPRRLVLIGGALLALGLISSSYVHALWQVVLLYGIIMTLGANCLGLVVFVPMLSRHFVQNRGIAVAIVQSANGFARGFSAPLTQLLIGELGWRWTYLVQGGFMAAAILPLSALFRGTDPSCGCHGWGYTRRLMPPAPSARTSFGCCSWSTFTGLVAFCGPAPTGIRVTVGFDKLYAAQSWNGALFSFRRDRLARIASGASWRSSPTVHRSCRLRAAYRGPDQHLLFWLHACFFGLTWRAWPSITAKTADLFPGSQLGTILGRSPSGPALARQEAHGWPGGL
jgi:MFS family permease